MALDYVFTFANDPGGHVIDYVDVGMPNGNFDMSTSICRREWTQPR